MRRASILALSIALLAACGGSSDSSPLSVIATDAPSATDAPIESTPNTEASSSGGFIDCESLIGQIVTEDSPDCTYDGAFQAAVSRECADGRTVFAVSIGETDTGAERHASGIVGDTWELVTGDDAAPAVDFWGC